MKTTGVTAKQIRHWETKRYIPEAVRINYGVRAYRWFTGPQVEFIRSIKMYLDQGYTLQAAVEKTRKDMPFPKGGSRNE